MSGPTSYTTIDAEPGQGADVELEVRHSRFLTRIRRVTTEPDARAVIEERRKAHFDAGHHCSAFVLGPDGRTARSSDDGEPSGTAGVPMLGVLTHHGLTDVVAVVTRYFGGIKLGAGGLVRAYSDAVAQAVAEAGTREVRLNQLLALDADSASAGTLEGQLRGLTLPGGATVDVTEVVWAETARIIVSVPSGTEDEFHVALAALTAGRMTAEPAGTRWA